VTEDPLEQPVDEEKAQEIADAFVDDGGST
jgi:hypothetical protein